MITQIVTEKGLFSKIPNHNMHGEASLRNEHLQMHKIVHCRYSEQKNISYYNRVLVS